MMNARWRHGAAIHAHIARFAAAYPCLNRGADFRFLANNRRANPRSTRYAIRAGKNEIELRPQARTDIGFSIEPKLSRLIEHAIDLARHNEVVLVHGAGKHF